MKDTTEPHQLQLFYLVFGRNLRGTCPIYDCNYKDLQTFVGLPLERMHFQTFIYSALQPCAISFVS